MNKISKFTRALLVAAEISGIWLVVGAVARAGVVPPEPVSAAAAVPSHHPAVLRHRVSAAAAEARGGKAIALESGAGEVVKLAEPAANVFVADPKVAEVRPASANTLFVFGVGPGRTTVAAMDAKGAVLSQFTVTVRPSHFVANEATAAISRLLPGSRVQVSPEAKGLLLTGSVSSPGDAARAAAIARGYLPAGEQMVQNEIAVGAQIQVALRVRIAEMSRTITRALGINWQAMGSLGRFSVNFLTNNALSSLVTATPGSLSLGFPDANAIIDALAQDNLVRILAEPNLTVMSGEPASFLAGGEFPIPIGQQNNQVTVEFKKYGVSLTFVPTVLADGRINLHVNPEVSQLTTQGAVQVSAGNSSISIPALTVRRADTTVELGSGQSFAIAGLLQSGSTQNDTGLPGLGDLPVLGPLFRSDAFQHNESELVIVVTPYIVRPVDDPAKLALPTDAGAAPSDFDRILRLRQLAGAAPGVPAHIPGAAGFIVE
jgi:pilus assembly protein CpaC